jgi:hypothetical protein
MIFVLCILAFLFVIWLVREFYTVYQCTRDYCIKVRDKVLVRTQKIDREDPRRHSRIKTPGILWRHGHHRHVICTTYFARMSSSTAWNNDKTRQLAPCDSYKYMAKWYESVQQLIASHDGLQAFVFYTGLSNQFVQTYETRHIHFVPCTRYGYSPSDEAFFVYREMLHQCRPSAIAVTSMANVIVRADPFRTVLDRYPSSSTFFAADSQKHHFVRDDRRIAVRSWKEVERTHKEFWFRLPKGLGCQTLCSPDCYAGYVVPMTRFLDTVCDFLAQLYRSVHPAKTRQSFIVLDNGQSWQHIP